VAIPEQRAKVFNATLSPRRRFLAGPVTVATLATGSNSVPSFMCHSTLFISSITAEIACIQAAKILHRRRVRLQESPWSGILGQQGSTFDLPKRVAVSGVSPTTNPP
jgi:hypothetical protein